MLTVGDIYNRLNLLAPFVRTVEPDNVGLLVGRRGAAVDKVLVALDATPEVIAEAGRIQAQLIVTHHPVFFKPLSAVNDDSLNGRRVLNAIEAGVAIISMHTNLDMAVGGVNDCLAQKLGLSKTLILPGGDEILRYGEVDKTDVHTFARHVAQALGANGLRYVDGGRMVNMVAVGGGACAEYAGAAFAAGCDTIVVGDSAYHRFQAATELGINMIDAGHFATEDVVCERLIEYIRDGFADLTVEKSAVLKDDINWILP